MLLEVKDLVKEFKVVKKERGLRGAISGMINRKTEKRRAVDGISFEISEGEIVGFIGPNGAGKSTTVKMMTGILYPTSGTVSIGGFSPQQNRKSVVGKLGVVFGQRTQLYWDLRLGESFELLKRIYRIDNEAFDRSLKLMDEVLGLDKIINIPVRQLSLGQRMRGDLAAAMLHSPPMLFLDEPTIGLDVEAKHSIRDFIKEINRKKSTTIILTTHDIADVEKLCQRLIVINHGQVVEDGPINSIIDRLSPCRSLMVELAAPRESVVHPVAEKVGQDGLRVWFRFDRNRISAADLISDLTRRYPISDLCVKEPDIEDMVREIYKRS